MKNNLQHHEHRHSFFLKIGKCVDAGAHGWGIVGVVAFALVIALIFFLADVTH